MVIRELRYFKLNEKGSWQRYREAIATAPYTCFKGSQDRWWNSTPHRPGCQFVCGGFGHFSRLYSFLGDHGQKRFRL